MKIKSLLVGCLLAAIALLAPGCGAKHSAAGPKSFDGAPIEIKRVWDKAWSADQANNYLVAAQGYKALLNNRDSLKLEQAQTVEQANGKLLQRLVNAAAAGDVAAKQALQSLQPGRRP